jgi:hypothetical protein
MQLERPVAVNPKHCYKFLISLPVPKFENRLLRPTILHFSLSRTSDQTASEDKDSRRRWRSSKALFGAIGLVLPFPRKIQKMRFVREF